MHIVKVNFNKFNCFSKNNSSFFSQLENILFLARHSFSKLRVNAFLMSAAQRCRSTLYSLRLILYRFRCTFCGITMRKYVESNISQKSQTTIKYLLKMGASVCETIIFMYLGCSAVSTNLHWDTAFVLITLGFCLVFRTLGGYTPPVTPAPRSVSSPRA